MPCCSGNSFAEGLYAGFENSYIEGIRATQDFRRTATRRVRMKISRSVSTWLKVSSMATAALLLPVVASAQRDEGPGALPFALGAGMLGFFFICFIAFYVYMALALQTIANKTNTENAWLAWIPIVNIILMLNIARKPIWWIILFFIPLVNIVMAIMVWMAVAEARGKPSWWGVLIIIPVANLVVPGVLAWSD